MHVNTKNPAISFLLFIPLYTLSIIHIVMLGATGNVVPPDSIWFQFTSSLLTHASFLAGRLFIVCIPLFLILHLNVIWSRRLLIKEVQSITYYFVGTILGVMISYPLLIVMVYIYISFGFLISWPLIVLAWSATCSLFFLIYIFTINGIVASNRKHVIVQHLSNPGLWLLGLLLLVILSIPSLALINPLHKGYFRFFPTGELFIASIPDLLSRSFWISLVLSALPVILHRLEAESLSDSGSEQ
ncbi:MAG: hypothetical protein JSW61_01865 [Candidatus Thorarchaeota archaeon]|nr:MAG: hypothetical protein JSW61_01865 [Candidatus Thorarchaeota archaeon]